jgi:hypothetical protein
MTMRMARMLVAALVLGAAGCSVTTRVVVGDPHHKGVRTEIEMKHEFSSIGGWLLRNHTSRGTSIG